MKRPIARGLAVVFGLMAVIAAAPSSILPDTAAGRRVAAYFEAFNSGREETMRAFIEANVGAEALKERPVERRLEIYRQMRDEHGTLTPVRVLDHAEDHVHVIVRTRFDRSLDLTFLFEAAAPHGFLGLRVMDAPGGAGAEEQIAPLSEEGAVEAWRARIDSLVRADRFSGAVLLAKDGRPLFKAAYGEASRARHLANRADTRFNLGSINKIFTKLAIAQLVEQGKVRLDDTLDKYLPDYPKAVASRVTVRQLLAHRGGIGDIFGDAYDRIDHSRLRAVSDWIPLFRDLPLAFEPGTREEYSNGGYVLLGAIVERASGEDYYDYMRRHIYSPLGMKDTDAYESDGRTPNLAAGYTRERLPGVTPDASGWVDNQPTRPFRGSPAGGGYSTLDDLLRFTEAMRAGKLLKPQTIAGDFREFQPNEKGELGLGIGGGAPGINAGIETLGPYTVIVLANLDPPAAERTARWLSRRLPYDGPRLERRMIAPGHGAPAGGGAGAKEPEIEAPTVGKPSA